MNDLHKTLKICVGYHKPSFLLEGSCFVPVWGGKAVATEGSKDGQELSEEENHWMQNHCIGDDTGDNISAKNRSYCEATILYWMWKNYDKLGNPDYIGFLQYRRHWVLNECYEKLYKTDLYNLLHMEHFSADHQYKIGLTDRVLLNLLDDCDGIFCVNAWKKSVYDYKQNHSQEIKYWDRALDIIRKKWPKYAQAAEKYNQGHTFVWSNCFIMKREDFLEYAPFLFDVLSQIEQMAAPTYADLTPEQMRVPAYVSETMLGVFFTYLREKGEKFKSYPLMYIREPFVVQDILPKHVTPLNKEAIPVVFIADENYLNYTSVAIKSIIQNASDCHFYDIIIFHDGKLSKEAENRILSMQKSNVSIRFFNASYYMIHYNFNNFFHKRLNLMSYLKLFIHEILAAYDKAIFLDGDMLVLSDLAELYKQSLDGKLVGAVCNMVLSYLKTPFWDFRRDYIIKNNKIKNINHYFNSGMLLLDLSKMRDTPELINQFINEARFNHVDRLHHDQDVLSFVLEDNVKYFSVDFNFQRCMLFPVNQRNIPLRIKKELSMPREIKILHFDGDLKPWSSLTSNIMDDIWWQYARQTPFYEEILCGKFKNLAEPNNNEILRDIANFSKNRFSYYRSKLLANLTWGKKKEHYKEKKRKLKQKIRKVRRFLKGK